MKRHSKKTIRSRSKRMGGLALGAIAMGGLAAGGIAVDGVSAGTLSVDGRNGRKKL